MAENIVDVGERMTGAHKDRHGIRLSDLSGLNDAESVKLAVKNKVWPEPDYIENVKSGKWDQPCAAAIMLIRNRTANKPLDYTGGRNVRKAVEDYVDVMSYMAEELDKCATIKDVVAVYPKLAAHYRVRREDKGDDREAYLDRIRAILSVAQKVNQENPCMLTSRDNKKVSDILNANMVNPDAEEWQRGYTIAQRSNQRGPVYVYKHGKLMQDLSGRSTRDEALAAIKDYEDKRSRGEVRGKKRGYREIPRHLSSIERVGPDRRKGDVSGDDLLRDFNLRAVEFGEWLPNKERQRVVNMAYDSLCDLAELMGLKQSELGLNKTIALAFGSRGHAGAAAHFEVKRSSEDDTDFGLIHMTRMSGAGSLAHEFGHALDWWMYAREHGTQIKTMGDGKRHVAMATDGYRKMKTPEIFQAIVESMRMSPRPTEEWNDIIKRTAERSPESAARNGITKENLERAERDPSFRIPTSESLAAAINRRTEYLINSMRSNRPNYYASSREMFARAFECFVYDTLEKQGLRSDYLVNSVHETFSEEMGMDFNPYPSGDERRLINDVMEAVVICTAEQMRSMHKTVDYSDVRERESEVSSRQMDMFAP